MKNYLCRLVAAFAVLFASLAALAQTEPSASFAKDFIWLISPTGVIESRTGRSAEPISDYILRIEAEARAHFVSSASRVPISGALFIAVRPGYASKVWVEVGAPGLPADDVAILIKRIEALKPMPVKDGPIAFAVSFQAWGGGTKLVAPQGLPLPLPAEWVEALNNIGGGMLPDDALKIVWPANDG